MTWGLLVRSRTVAVPQKPLETLENCADVLNFVLIRVLSFAAWTLRLCPAEVRPVEHFDEANHFDYVQYKHAVRNVEHEVFVVRSPFPLGARAGVEAGAEAVAAAARLVRFEFGDTARNVVSTIGDERLLKQVASSGLNSLTRRRSGSFM